MTAVTRARGILVAAVALGLAARLATVWVAPRFGYLPDHLDAMAWSAWAYRIGAPAIYDMQPELVPMLVASPAPERLALAPHACNYPPFSAWVFWGKGAVWWALDVDVRTIPAPPSLRPLLEQRGWPTTFEVRTVNTRLARAVDAAPSLLFDVLLALGVMRLVALLGGVGPVGGAAAFALVFVAPAVVLDGALWGQSDAWLSAMLVWCLAAWLRGRFAVAGALYGLALTTKPQAVLFAPVLAHALLALRYRAGGSWMAAARGLRALPAGLLVAALAAAPCMLHDARGGAGAWRWLQRSYLGTIGSDEYAYTTLNAFNLWWLELLARRPWSAGAAWWRLLDSTAPIAGITKDAVGAGLLLGALALVAWLVARRALWSGRACATVALVVLLSAFLLPTRVHERYVYYAIPFATVLAVSQRAWIPWLVLTLVGAGEMLSHLWVAPTLSSFAWSGTAALAALGVLPWTYGMLARCAPGEERRRAETGAAAPSPPVGVAERKV